MANPFEDLRALADKIDLKRITSLARHVDLVKLISIFSELEPADLAHLASRVRAKHRKKPLPAPHGDFYDVGSMLKPEELAERMRTAVPS